MAKGKKSKSSGYQSKGLYKNVNKKTRNAVRKDRNNVQDQIHSREYRRGVISSPKSVKEGARLKEKFLQEEAIERIIAPLLNRFGPAGLTRAEAIHAAKTDYVATLTEKWGTRYKNWKDVNKNGN